MKKFVFVWMLLVLGVPVFCQSVNDDTTAIKQLLEKESATWRSADFKGHSECWHIQPYSRILVSTTDGKSYDVPPALMKDPSAKLGNGGTFKNSNYKIHVNGNEAWVSHDEESTAVDGTKTYSWEMRMLEKIDGQWKLVGQSIHLHK